MRKLRVMALAIVVALWPSTGHAGFLAWLEELSGPGPFTGEVYSFTIGCVGTEGFKFCPVGDPEFKRTIVLRVAWFNSDADTPRFKDLPATDADNQGKVSVLPVSGLYLFRLRPWLDVGPGAGFMRVSGRGFSPFYRLVLTPMSASFTPFALHEKWQRSPWSQVLRLELDTSFVPQGFTGADFQNSRTSFDSGPEFLTRAAIVVDLGALVGGARTLRR